MAWIWPKEKKSERTELEYQMAPEIIRKDAPFGTESTPTITMKIIAGKHVPVIEKPPIYNNDFAGSRIQPLRPIADKPNHLDPRVHGDNPGGYYNRDVQDYFQYEDEAYVDPTNYVNKRPDSKDVVRNQFKALPPIQQNRTRNDLSTVFEAEPWTDNRNPALADDTEYKHNYFSGRKFDNGMDNYQSGGGKDFHYVSDLDKKSLFMLLPRNVLLPVDPLKLSREQETTLCKLVCNELNRLDPEVLRDVYVECSQYDKELRGFCKIEILDNILRNHKAFLTDTLRIIAAQYVDANYPGMVNYDSTISFIKTALLRNGKGQLGDDDEDSGSQEKQPKYYLQNGESFKTGSIYRDREVAKLLRMVEQELSKNSYMMDWTRWQNSFYERDRDHRETLSAAQIKDICYDQKLPLSDSLINNILNLCEDNNRDGQYRWHAFLEFLSRVRPSNTGLPIPRRGTSPRRDISPRRGENRPDDREASSPDLSPPPRPSYLDRSPLPNLRLDSPSPSNRSLPPTPRERYRPPRYPIKDEEGFYSKQNRDRNYSERYNRYDDEYERSRRDFYEDDKWNTKAFKRRSYSESPSGYQPSWQENVPKKSSSPPPSRRMNGRDTFRRDERPEDPAYERHWKNWAYKNSRDTRPLQRVPSRYDRPKSYADPPRKTSFPKLDEKRRRPYSYRDDLRYNDRDNYQQRDGRNSYREGYRQGGGQGDAPPRAREQQIMQLSHQLHDLESRYEVTKEAMTSRDKPWLDRYLKLAQALYDSDISNKGSLPRKDVMDIVLQYNKAFNLNLDPTRANMESISPDNLDKSGNVILRSFLAKLSADRTPYNM